MVEMLRIGLKRAVLHLVRGGRTIETHWYENLVTGVRAEFKTVIDAAMKKK